MSAQPRKGLFGWLDRRYDLAPILAFMQHKEVPLGAHPMFWYYLGGLTLFFFSVQIATGILLLVYYQVGDQTSYESIHFITTKVPFGWLVRSIHCWSAHLMILCLVLHMLSTMMLKAYRQPRELTWLTGFSLFGLALCFGFSGYLLPWNELAFFATAVGTDMVKAVPWIGHTLLEVLRGGPDVSGNTLYRFFALHVVVLPLIVGAVIAIHLIFIQKQGMAPPIGHTVTRGMKFFPDFALRDGLLWLICLILLATLAVFLPYGPGIPGIEWELGKKANPLAPAYPGIKPEWYFLWVYQLLKEFPPHILGMEGSQAALLVATVLFGVWALLPFLDRRAAREEPSPIFTDLGAAALLFVAFLTMKAWDIGGGGGPQPDAHAVARTCAIFVLVAGLAATALRRIVWKHTWFLFTAAELLHVALHGLVGMSYLAAGAIGFVAAAVGVVLTGARAQRTAAAGDRS
ncbi:MAG TPA: cytochrome bc complex cytochrome b subunit [Myxococcales bacterium]|nr:cytochrome bc complex cytochrome b subunit [Myxococcales bacterium]